MLIFLCSFAVFYFEHSETEANIHSLWDGFWWAIVTVGTVGYGDRYPVSVAGRLLGMLLIFSGVGLMLLLTATIASVFVERKLKEARLRKADEDTIKLTTVLSIVLNESGS